MGPALHAGCLVTDAVLSGDTHEPKGSKNVTVSKLGVVKGVRAGSPVLCIVFAAFDLHTRITAGSPAALMLHAYMLCAEEG